MKVVAVILGACCAFFIFYTVRLLVVTGFLQNIRPGGGGAYMGAVVFPVLAIVFGLASRACWRRGSGQPT